jgi:hypothetical protein
MGMRCMFMYDKDLDVDCSWVETAKRSTSEQSSNEPEKFLYGRDQIESSLIFPASLSISHSFHTPYPLSVAHHLPDRRGDQSSPGCRSIRRRAWLFRMRQN